MEHRRDIRFAADRSLGRLSKWLRILGFDALYETDDSGTAFKAFGEEGRILLTRITGYRKRLQNLPLIFIHHDRVRDQLRQVVDSVPVFRTDIRLFSRCIRCNLPLQPAERSNLYGSVPEYIWQTHERFKKCTGCGRTFWRGTHGDAAFFEIDHLFQGPPVREGTDRP